MSLSGVGLAGEALEVPVQLFEAFDPKEPTRFPRAYVAAAPCLAIGGAPRWTLFQTTIDCAFTVGVNGYGIEIALWKADEQHVEDFREAPVILGLTEDDGQFYVTVRIGRRIDGVTRFEVRDFVAADDVLPQSNAAHGNGITLKLFDHFSQTCGSARFLVMPVKFIGELRSILARQIAASPCREIRSESHAGVSTKLSTPDDFWDASRVVAFGRDCPVRTAWVSEEASKALMSDEALRGFNHSWRPMALAARDMEACCTTIDPPDDSYRC
jgi:hypothetical protein